MASNYASYEAGWKLCVHIPDLPMLVQLTLQQLTKALAGVEAAVLQVTSGKQQLIQQQVNPEPPAGQGALLQHRPAVPTRTPQQQQQHAELASVVASLGLESHSYQALLEDTAMIAEVEHGCRFPQSNSLRRLFL